MVNISDESVYCGFRLLVYLLDCRLKQCATPSRSLDDHCSAGHLYRLSCASSRRPYTHATCDRRIDAKASFDEAVVDVEVDRCAYEN